MRVRHCRDRYAKAGGTGGDDGGANDGCGGDSGSGDGCTDARGRECGLRRIRDDGTGGHDRCPERHHCRE